MEGRRLGDGGMGEPVREQEEVESDGVEGRR